MLITIGHTYGSGGLEIGRRLAAGWRSPAATRSPTKGPSAHWRDAAPAWWWACAPTMFCPASRG
ncbi:MAG: hypothetical protein ACLRIS_05930 [Flavonifractor plautii]